MCHSCSTYRLVRLIHCQRQRQWDEDEGWNIIHPFVPHLICQIACLQHYYLGENYYWHMSWLCKMKFPHIPFALWNSFRTKHARFVTRLEQTAAGLKIFTEYVLNVSVDIHEQERISISRFDLEFE